MATYTAPWYLLTILASCCVISLANTDIIRLDMSPVRGSSPPTTKRYPIRAPPPAIPPEQKADVFCTDGQTPDDFFCDMRRFYASDTWTKRFAPDLYDIDLDYPDPQGTGAVCTANFMRIANATVGTTLRLPFSSFSCVGGSGVPSGLPALRMASVTELRVTVRRPNELHYRCIFSFKNAGSIGSSRGGRANGFAVVRFLFDRPVCVSPVVADRQTTAATPCEDNGRRCRPRK